MRRHWDMAIASSQLGVCCCNKLSIDHEGLSMGRSIRSDEPWHPTKSRAQTPKKVAVCDEFAETSMQMTELCVSCCVKSLPTAAQRQPHDSIHPQQSGQPPGRQCAPREPFLDDPYFEEGRRFVSKRGRQFCFVLNNYVDIDVDEVMDDLPTGHAHQRGGL